MPESEKGSINDIFTISSWVPRMGWILAQTLYKKASSRGGNNALYTRLRQSNNYNNPGMALRVMGYDIRRKFIQDETPLLVAHPTLVGILKGKPNLIYQHGELVAPNEALLTGDHYTLVPTQNVANRFIQAGSPSNRVIVTGLCIEPTLLPEAELMYERRLQRIKESPSLCGAFFSSGAEPIPHIKKLLILASSHAVQGGHSIIFAKKGGKLEEQTSSLLTSLPSKASERIELHPFTTRQEINALITQHFASFDFFVAPSHERTNWALGLGLPILVLDPPIGTFSPLNRELLLTRHVAKTLSTQEDAAAFGKACHSQAIRNELTAMAKNGWGKEKITGFETIRTFLQNIAAEGPVE